MKSAWIYNLIYVTIFNFLGDYCSQPEYRIMSYIRRELGTKWKHIGYTLGLEHSVLNCIEHNNHQVEERSFNMLEEWMQRDVEACYCKLISAMERESLCSGAEALKSKIKPSNFST